MSTCVFLIYGVKVSLITNNLAFKNFVQATLQNYGIVSQENHKFQISVRIDFNKKTQIKKSKFRVGNGVFLDEKHKKLAIQHKLFLGEFTQINSNNLSIRGEVDNNFKNKVKHFIKSLAIKNYSYKEMLFHQLYRELILMPVFWVLRHKFEKHLMHASAVSNGKQTLVFLGNDGVGKTTVALKLLKKEDTSFFGDNFLLYDSNKIYAFVDTLRVNKNDSKAIKTYESSSIFKKVYQGKSRTHYNFNKDYISKSARPTQFFVLKQSNKNSKTTISKDQFINYTLAINDYVKEFDKYSYASNLIFLYDTQFNIEQQETDFLSKLVSDSPCALLSLNKDQEVFDLFNKDN
ncbi:hypothetical protein [Ichthyenterobacterium magnum]|uniref:Uncharacterized protein n=1 Tax=Ichthyenterobacterium magnum TaxID=1230530 RepID=A0A420DX60_9FLAO|nr:hypothetical protein [Ichthyenterobacterium magnum]RKE98830.1 hypothetical protein BXY80_0925 [Ichthyenterobacterium magnum]